MKADREEFEERYHLSLVEGAGDVLHSCYKKLLDDIWQWIQQNYVSKAKIDKMIEKLRGSPDWHSCEEVEEILTELKDKTIKKGIFRWNGGE